jgi:hypothetical protein
MTLAYFDSFSGLIPCRIVAVGDWNDAGSMARVKFTAKRGLFERGEFYTTPLRNIVPRHAVYRRNFRFMIRPYDWSKEREKVKC